MGRAAGREIGNEHFGLFVTVGGILCRLLAADHAQHGHCQKE